MKETGALGIYIHIPFCRHKCDYCDFYSLAHSEEKMDAYTEALVRHLEEVAPRCAAQAVDTVYFGGGTPSYLGEKRLIKLLKAVKKRYRMTADAEITLECNPDSAQDKKALKKLRRAGFNRLSLGVQAMDDAALRAVGRIHTVEQVRTSVEAIRAAGFQNLSLDLIYGLPGQTREQWRATLEAAAALAPEHLSCYGLKVEEGTPLWAKKDSLSLSDDDAQADMYLFTVDYLARQGYAQYEISNFARPGCESRHNLRYWQLREYAGFGPGAHSDMGGVRFAYARDIDAYIAGEMRLSEREEIDPMDRDMETIMLSLRMSRGLDLADYGRRFRQKTQPLETLFREYEAHGLAQPTESGWRLTPRGFLVSNSIIAALQEAVTAVKRERMEAAARGDYRVEHLL